MQNELKVLIKSRISIIYIYVSKLGKYIKGFKELL